MLKSLNMWSFVCNETENLQLNTWCESLQWDYLNLVSHQLFNPPPTLPPNTSNNNHHKILIFFINKSGFLMRFLLVQVLKFINTIYPIIYLAHTSKYTRPMW